MGAAGTECNFDAIVIGSGMGGLACGSALTRMGHKVLVLERHFVAGGLTQTFSRNGFTWDVGVHYLGEMGPVDMGRRVLNWLSGGAIEFASIGPVYDIMYFPDHFEFQCARPQEALERELKERFASSTAEIDAYFQAVAEATATGRALFSARAMPPVLAKLVHAWSGRAIDRWWGRTTDAVLQELVSDPKLRAVLAGQRGDYGPDPCVSSFGIHATVTRHYFDGAYYPIHGAKAFADALVPVIEEGGGQVRTRADVTELLIDKGAIAGVRLKDGTEVHCPLVFSDAGARNTVMHLLPPALRDAAWVREIASFQPSACHVQLYLGLEGDIRASGATPSNHWFHESWDLGDALWRDPEHDQVPPTLFVSFPSLKDIAQHTAMPAKHTAELVAWTDWTVFAQWEDSRIGHRPPDYAALKRVIEERLLAQFARHFPALAPMIMAREVSTPLTSVAFTGAVHGGVYGIEASPRRFFSDSLRARTPVPGLFLTGQDISSAGITGAMMGGVIAAAALEPRIMSHVPLR
ncbi:MAG: phytoene desaturase family protein [Steroidobacteraceae bacterium]